MSSSDDSGSPAEPHPSPLDEWQHAVLRKTVHCDRIDDNLYLATPDFLFRPVLGRSVFGGQIIAQSLFAAQESVVPSGGAGFSLNSLRCNFLHGGDADANVVYSVRPLLDGRSFCTRLVLATQAGRTIFVATVSFHDPQNEARRTLHYADAYPTDVPDVASLTDNDELARGLLASSGDSLPSKMRAFLEQYLEQPMTISARECAQLPLHGTSSRRALFMKARARLPPDARTHQVCLAYMSDSSLLNTALSRVGGFLQHQPAMWTSLDHSVHMHMAANPDGTSAFRADEWLLFDCRCHSFRENRALVVAKVFSAASGELVCTLMQEGLIRMQQEIAAPAPVPYGFPGTASEVPEVPLAEPRARL